MFSVPSRLCLLRNSLSAPGIVSSSSTRLLTPLRTYATQRTTKKAPSEVAEALGRQASLYKTYKPVTPSIRHLRRPINAHLYPGGPVRALTTPLRKTGGRNAQGRITVRGRGGGHRRRIRAVDFVRSEPGPHDVVRIEYDPGRSAHIALVKNRNPYAPPDKVWSYILACEDLRAGDVVQSFAKGIPEDFLPDYLRTQPQKGAEPPTDQKDGRKADGAVLAQGLLRAATLKPGNVLPLRLIPEGTIIHNVSLRIGGRGILIRSAGSFGSVVAHEENGRYSHVRLQSGEIRKVLSECCATIGKVSNPLWQGRVLAKAGRNRWLGRRPKVRGVAMNANDHPHGGGRGKSKSNKHPVSIWGWQTKGKRTRKPGPKGPKNSNKMVIRERPRGKDKTVQV